MPREIIDTQRSRPAYIRRNILVATLVALVVALVMVYAYEAWSAGHRPAPTRPAAARHPQIPGK